ncbi:hypothetical protein [Laceyella tengchongensis]|jgi:hypothetical protein|uniref:hypothetical protein n=1 Tax=Laceyella tengchongensis TaxID=574699 RepID=UPI0012B770A4|nr:hypothetical protein [Laceyella tengchongensis]
MFEILVQMMEGKMNVENKKHVPFHYNSANGDKENMVWLLKVELPVVPGSTNHEVLEMVYVNGCWEYKSCINQ